MSKSKQKVKGNGNGHEDHGNGNGYGHESHGNGNGYGHYEGTIDPVPVTVDAVNDTAAVGQGGSVSGNVLANDTVTGAAIQSVQLVTGPGNGSSVSLAADGSYTYSAGAGFASLAQGETGTDTFTYSLTAVGGTTDSATVTVTVTGANDAPVANADAASGLENQIITLDLLGNDTDVDNGAVLSMLSASTDAGQGSVSVTGNTVLFDPGSDFDYLGVGDSATVIVNYTMQDQFGAASSSTATVTVVGENDGPLSDPSKSLFVLAPGVTPLDIQAPTDADGDALEITITQATGIGELRDGDGNVVTLGSSVTAEQLESLGYTPASGAGGTVVFVSYTVSDGNGGSAASTVALFVIAGAPVIPGATSGTLGVDSFDFNVLGAPPAVIDGFAAGDNGDVLDVSDLLVGYIPGTSDASTFVALFEAGGNTVVAVNADGIGGDLVPVAALLGETGLTVSEMLADGNLFLG